MAADSDGNDGEPFCNTANPQNCTDLDQAAACGDESSLLQLSPSLPQPASKEVGLHGTESLGTAICIVGQLVRLEVESKIQNLLLPLASQGNVSVFVSLEVNRQPQFFSLLQTRSGDAELVKKLFKPWYVDGAYVTHINFSTNRDSFPALWRWNRHNDTALIQRLISNTVNQFRLVAKCADLIKAHEAKAGIVFDRIIKIRDNTLALKPLLPFPLGPSVHVKDCASWHGVPDKIMVLPRIHMDHALGSPLRMMQKADSGDASLRALLQPIRNSEGLLRKALELNGVPWSEHPAEELPLVDGRPICGSPVFGPTCKYWMLVPSWKDCYPAEPWTWKPQWWEWSHNENMVTETPLRASRIW